MAYWPAVPNVKVGRTASSAFKALFAIATVVAAFGTYVSVTDVGPRNTGQSGLFWLLLGNLFVIASIAGILGARVVQLMRENRETGGGARLRLRIIALFSIAAGIPTIIVAGFLAAIINRSVESWFSERIYALVENASAAAEASQNEVRLDVQSHFRDMADDINTYAREFEANTDDFQAFTLRQAEYHDFPRVSVYRSDGDVVFEAAADGAPPDVPPTQKNWTDAREGFTSISVDGDAVRAFYRLPSFSDAFLYVSRPMPQRVGARLVQTQQDLDAFREAETRRDRLRTVLTLSYLQVAVLMLLGTAWLGVTAAARIAIPLGQLAQAARAVRDGDLSVRMQRPAVRDEIDDLADAFNQMTDRIARQTAALERARGEAESRSAFTEAVLAGVEAGVMRIDSRLNVTIANTSAVTMLQMDEATASIDLTRVAPEFIPAVRRAFDTGQSVEASLKRVSGANVAYFHLRVAPERDGGGVVATFHDTTRMIAGQRQAAWRDVARRIAHEIRNPLTPIQLSAERLRRRFGGQITQDRDTFDRCTETILRQVSDIGRMVEEFSGFARMPKPSFSEFNLGEMIRAVAFSQRMAAPSIAVTVDGPDQPILVRGDERLLAQALTNIVKNAAEAVEHHVQTGESKSGSVAIEFGTDMDEAFIVVRDTGPGFPVDDRDRLLEPYVTTRRSGVGLGLAIVARIVQDHGGRIILSDNELVSRGARVDLRMPIEPQMSEEFTELAEEGAV
ncbi:HAMP domain-containing protein [bacterium]|nr:HAMP domain-containing protein [bacterium]